MKKTEGLIFGYTISADGETTLASLYQDKSKLSDHAFNWFHLDHKSDMVKQWIKEESHLPEIVVQSLLSVDTRPRIVKFNEGVLINLRGLNLNPESDKEDMVYLHMWIEKHRIITIRDEKVYAIDEINDMINNGIGPRSQSDFLRLVIHGLTTRIADFISYLEDQVDELEDNVLTYENKQLRSRLSEMRRKIILIRRYIVPQRDVLSNLNIDKMEWIDEHNRIYIREYHERTTRLVEELDTIRDRAAITQEELNNKISEQMNRTMYILSIVGSIFLPLGFFTGLFGINIGGMPGVDNEYAFLMFSGIMVFIAFIEYLIFKKNNWL